jgi:hypothetical protein
MKAGDLVRYVRATPEEAHLIYEVSAIMEDDDGVWIMLAEEEDPDVEIAPGIMGGFGGWEDAVEFGVISEGG